MTMSASNDNAGQPPLPCPICGKPSVAEYHPFCSKRCANVDLHRWLSDGYVIPSTPDEEEQADIPDADAEDNGR